MQAPPFAHLHLHTEYSLLDGACRIDCLVKQAMALGMKSLALTDHGVLYGVVPFYDACRKAGLRPVIGCEVYLAPRSRFDKAGKSDSELGHLLLLAENDQGYRNLLALASAASLEGFYYKPRVDRELLERHHQGLICLTACLSGSVPSLILQDREQDAASLAGWYRDLFGPENFFLEIQSNGIAEQDRVNRALVEISRQLGAPLVATNDVHYLEREDAAYHDILLCVQTGASLDQPKRLRFQSDQFYLKSPQEMVASFAEQPEAVARTTEIAERCRVELDFSQTLLPHFETPPGTDVDSYLRQLCLERLPRRYPGDSGIARQRLDYELGVIKDKGLSAYLLIVWDSLDFARRQGIVVGPGRGSCPGSLAAYLLGIHSIDPLTYGLLFERFLNPERMRMPDIDSDFEDARRDEVIQYVSQRYGQDRVAQIITFGTMQARLAVRDVGRVLKIPIPVVDRIAKMIDPSQPIEDALSIAEVRQLYDTDQSVRQLLETARRLEGIARQAGTHAAGVVISQQPLAQVVPLQRSTEGTGVITQYDMDAVQQIGLLKMDFLGLRTLTVLKDAIRLVKQTRGQQVDLDSVPLNDQTTYRLLCRAETAGVFQLESAGMRQMLKDLRPRCFEDVIQTVALYRPGPMQEAETFMAVRRGKRAPDYPHPKLQAILEQTNGIIIFQEQVLAIARELAGFNSLQAEDLLKALSKKQKALMEKLKVDFVSGAREHGLDEPAAQELFGRMSTFAGYGFNKAHSAGYAMLAYWTAYMKANFPLEYMAAQLTSWIDNKDRIGAYVEECRRMGVEVLPPDINESQEDFGVQDGRIRFGLAAVKHVGRGAVQAMLAARAERLFADFHDFLSRVDPGAVNRTAVESLAKVGAFSCLDANRAQLLGILDHALETGQKAYRDRAAGQVSLFGSDQGTAPVAVPLPQVPEFPRDQLLAFEKEYLGVFISEHPLTELAARLRELEAIPIAQLGDLEGQQEVPVGGIITSCRKHMAKNNRPMLFATLEDLTGTLELTVFPDLYEQAGAILEKDALVLVRGRSEGASSVQGGDQPRTRMLASQVALLSDDQGVKELLKKTAKRSAGNRHSRPREERPGQPPSRRPASPPPAEPSGPPPVRITVSNLSLDSRTLQELHRVILSHPGDRRVVLDIHDNGGRQSVQLGQAVALSEQFLAAIQGLLGEGAMRDG